MKKLWLCFLTFVLAFSLTGPIVYAQEPSFEDTEYWNKLCGGKNELTPEQRKGCQVFMSQQSQDLNDKIQEINNKRTEIAKNIKIYVAKIKEYQKQADALNGKIAALNEQISVKQKEVERLEIKIEETQDNIHEAQEKLKKRMTSSQATMRLNPILDVLFGAKNFSDFIRIANGLRDITDYDERFIEKLAEEIEQLNKDKAQVQKEKDELSAAKKEVVDKQNELLALKYKAQVVEDEYRKQAAELEAQGNRFAARVGEIQKRMKELAAQGALDVAATPGWTRPIVGSRVSAGTWAYPGGGRHLGCDYAAPLGSPVRAAGNGVILASVDGCGPGYLGNRCGEQFGGSYGGGNQVYLLTKINGNLYAVKYLHLLAGSPIAKGTIVTSGQTVGLVGMSGNASGPHSHVEVYYLGDASNFTNYATTWNGDLAFGCGWGAAAMNRICERGSGAPCRMRPESVFGS